MLTIVQAPSAVLSQKATEVKKVNKSTFELVEEMKQTLLAVKDIIGVGLAAPQVGIPLRVFVMKPSEKTPFQVVINPKVISVDPIPSAKAKKGKSNVKLEGCLSLLNIWGTVKRASKVTISFLDENGLEHTKTFKGFEATIVQHEMDHLEGILFPKRVLEQKGELYKSHKNKKGEDIFDPIEI